jgi:PAS domain S-box-containing protein
LSALRRKTAVRAALPAFVLTGIANELLMGKLIAPLLRLRNRIQLSGDEFPSKTEPRFDQSALLKAMGDIGAGVWEWDLVSNETIWSDAVWTLYGLNRQTDRPDYASWLSSVNPNDRDAVAQAVRTATATGSAFEVEWRTHPKIGQARWLMARGQPIDVSKPQRYVGIVLDISQRKAIEHSMQELIVERTAALNHNEHLLQTILDGIPGLVGYWDRQLCNRFANKAYLDWFGRTPQEIHGIHISQLLGPLLYALNRPLLENALAGHAQHFEREIITTNGEARLSEAHYLPDVRDGEVQGLLVMIFDISRIKQAERAAEAANQAKSAFLANISHELRTPLNAMFGMAQLGCRENEGHPAERTFRHILQSGQHLMTLINDVLDFSRIEAGKMPIQRNEVDLAQMLEHVISMSAARAEAKGLAMVVTESPSLPRHFTGDTTRCTQILLNLLSNAIKFTEQGVVHLELDCINNELLLTVHDTGPGIPAEDAQRVFQPFEQVNRKQPTLEGGTGLGLAISQHLANLMGGSLTLTSTVGQGSAFTLHLPATDARRPEWHRLRGLCLLVAPTQASNALQKALLTREARIHVSTHLPHTNDAPTALLMNSTPLQATDQTSLQALLQNGMRLLLSAPASNGTKLDDTISAYTTLIGGPLSPLRILYAIEQLPPPKRKHAAMRLNGLRILAAEDNPLNRLVLGQMLELEGASVTFAFDGLQALELVKTQGDHAFDLVLCDIQMPLLDGYATTQALRQMAPSLPVIGLTAHAFSAAREQGETAGMVSYVTKPYMLDDLVREITRHARQPTPMQTQ